MKKLFPFAMIALSAGLVLAGCSDPVAPASSSSSEPGSSSPSSSSPAPVEATINVSADIPSEFAISGSFDLDDYVTVTGVTTFDVAVVSGPVAVNSDHVVTASGYGDYLIQVSAGNASKEISGTVISDGKAQINEIIGGMSENWTAKMTLGTDTIIYTYRNEHYVAAGAYSSDESYYVYDGVVEAPDGNNYAFTYLATLDHSVVTDLSWQYGIDSNIDAHGYTALAIDPALLEQVYDEDGNPMNRYVYSDQDSIATFVSDTFRYNWTAVMYNLYCEQFLVSVNEDGSVLFEAVDKNYFPVGFSILMSDIGTTEVAALETWYAAPVYPGKLDVTDIKGVLDSTKTAKNYTMEVIGIWSTSTMRYMYDCVEGMYSSSGVPMMFTFTQDVYVDDDTIYTDVTYCQDDVPTAYQNYGLVTDRASYYKSNPNGGVDITYGDITRATGTAEESVEWGTTSTESSWEAPFESRWTTGAITDELLNGANFRSKGTTTSGNDGYSLDGIADGGAFRKAVYESAGRGGYYLYNNMGYLTSVFDYLDEMIILSGTTDETTGVTTYDTFQYQAILPYDGTYYYYFIVIISDIGSTTIPHSPVVA